jgi:hypothetical protein
MSKSVELHNEDNKSESKRTTIQFGEADIQELEFLSTQYATSEVEIIRKSVRFHGKIQRRIATGAKLFLENTDGSIETILII